MSRTDELRSLVSEIEAEGLAVTAPLIVERSRDAQKWPELNRHFWGVAEAELAHEARLARAHRLLIMLHVTIAETGATTRLMVHTRGDDGYQSFERVAAQPDVVRLKLRQLGEDIGRARARLAGFRRSLPDDVAADIDDALRHAESLMKERGQEINAA